MRLHSILSFLGCFFVLNLNAQSLPIKDSLISVIPKPEKVIHHIGQFILTEKTRIYVAPDQLESKQVAEMLAMELKSKTGIILPVIVTKNIPLTNAIILITKGEVDTQSKEGYNLSVNNKVIAITAKTANGQFYGMQTLLQLLPVAMPGNKNLGIAIPAVTITDNPRFSWRGLMLDVGRYYYSVDFLKKFIDYMAMHKLNTFHWHLTEDHGWRIEIKKYPKLTQISSWREGTQFDRTQINNTPHGGYYTQEQVKELVAYAQARYITIVPEIEMPGHSLAALVAYPELSCTGGPFQMPIKWNIQKDVYCAGNEKTFEFLENVLNEVIALFPSPIIHIGGDECPKDRWQKCPKCQARIKEMGLQNEFELQSYFIRRIEQFLLTRNRTLIGWDEILEGGLAPNASVMSWRGIKGGIAAARQGHNTVMTPSDYYYLDYYQGEPYLEPIAIGNGGVTSLKKVYTYEPIPQELSSAEAKFIIGLQGNVWSEFIHSPSKVEYMLYPRGAAIAETGWTQPHLKDWNDFTRRMDKLYRIYDKKGIHYAKSAFNVTHELSIDSVKNEVAISLSTQSYKPVIHYTLDGSEPTIHSSLYSKPFFVRTPSTIKAATFRDGEMISKITEFAVIPATSRKD